MLDVLTLRVVFTVVAWTLLSQFYWRTYRPTRRAYSGWWCAALAFFMAGASAFLLDGTAQQWWANPLGNVGLVLGAAAVWGGARSLRAPARWLKRCLPAPAVVVAGASLLDDPARNRWSGGYLFLGVMGAFFVLGAAEFWTLWRTEGRDGPSQESYWRTVRPVAVVVNLLAVYYPARWVAFLALGPDDARFRIPFGSEAATLLTTVMLVVVSFSMSRLTNELETRALRVRASRDGLTGLLNRGEFMRLATLRMQRPRQADVGGSLILADLDHFKAVNDRYGHAVGDTVLQHFARACRDSVRETDLVGRLGGEEFVLLLPGSTPRRAERITADISRRLLATPMPDSSLRPTVSYGISCVDTDASLDRVIAAADAALYRAKDLGRDRAVRADDSSTPTGPECASEPEPVQRAR